MVIYNASMITSDRFSKQFLRRRSPSNDIPVYFLSVHHPFTVHVVGVSEYIGSATRDMISASYYECVVVTVLERVEGIA